MIKDQNTGRENCVGYSKYLILLTRAIINGFIPTELELRGGKAKKNFIYEKTLYK